MCSLSIFFFFIFLLFIMGREKARAALYWFLGSVGSTKRELK